VIYRGDVLKVEREGIRGLFYRSDRVETDISMNGNPPVGDEAEARRGMPQLDPLVEMGPAVKWFLYRGRRLSSLYVELAARGAIAIDPHDLGLRYEGERAGVSLETGRYRWRAGSPWSAGGRVGVDFADRKYHRYVYDVTPAEALPDRPAFRSDAGYGGCSMSGFVVRRLTPDVTASIYGRWEYLGGAAYEDSPLVRTKENYVVGAAVVWKLAESKTTVRVR
jgi:outer membrane scaffolding protein for murein synthesis (MipA/OmpV family)